MRIVSQDKEWDIPYKMQSYAELTRIFMLIIRFSQEEARRLPNTPTKIMLPKLWKCSNGNITLLGKDWCSNFQKMTKFEKITKTTSKSTTLFVSLVTLAS